MPQDHLFAEILDSFAQLEKWIPGCGSWPVDLLIGRLPDANPADVYRLADAWAAAATRVNSYYEEVAHLADPILSAWQGDGAPMVFQEVWSQHLQDVGSMIESLGSMQQVVQGYGLELEIEEFFIAFTLIQLLVEAIIAVIGAFFSGGLSLGGLAAGYAAARIGIKEAFEKCMQAILKLGETLMTGELRHLIGENTAKDLLRAGARQIVEHLGPRSILSKAAAEKAANQFRKDLVQSQLRRELRRELTKVATRAEARAAIRTLDRTAADLTARVAAELGDRLLVKFTAKAAGTVAERGLVDLGEHGAARLAADATDAMVEKFIQEQVAKTTLLGTAASYVGKLALHGAAFMGGVDFLAQGFELVTGERGSIDMSQVAISLGQGGLMGGLMFGHGLIGSMSTGGLAGTVTAAATDTGKAIYGAATGQDMHIQWKDDLAKGLRDGVRMGAVFAAPGVLGGMAARLAPHSEGLSGHEVFAFDDPRLGANVFTMDRSTGEIGFTTQHGGIGYRLADGSFVRIDADGALLARHVGGDFVDASGGPGGGGTGVMERPALEPGRLDGGPRVPTPRGPGEPGRTDPGRTEPGRTEPGTPARPPGLIEGEVVSSHVVEHPSAVNGHDASGDGPHDASAHVDDRVAPPLADRVASPAADGRAVHPDERAASRPEIPPERAPVRTPQPTPRPAETSHAEAVRASMQDRHAPPVLRAEQEAHLGRADTGHPAASVAHIERTVHEMSVAAREATVIEVRPESPTRWADAALPDTAPVDEFPARLFHDVLAARVPGGLAHAEPHEVRATAHELARQILATHELDIRSVDTARRLREYVAAEMRTGNYRLDRAATDRLADRAADEARAALRRDPPTRDGRPRDDEPGDELPHAGPREDVPPTGDPRDHAARHAEPVRRDAPARDQAGHDTHDGATVHTRDATHVVPEQRHDLDVPPGTTQLEPVTPPAHEHFTFTRKFVEFNRETREVELITEHVERRWAEADYGRPLVDGGHDGPAARELAHRAAQDLADHEYARIVDATDHWLDGTGEVRAVGEIGGMSAAVVLRDGRVVAATSVRERTDRVVDQRISEHEWSGLRGPERAVRSEGYAPRRKDLLAAEERGIEGNTHPLVRDALADVPARLRSQTHGRCAEPALLSRVARILEADGSAGGARFQDALRGAHIASHRNDGSPGDRSEQFPCSTDDQLLHRFDMRSDYVDRAIDQAVVDPSRRLVILADERPGDLLRDFATHLPDLPPDHLTVVVHARVDSNGGIAVRLGDRDAGGVELARVVQRIIDAHPGELAPRKVVLVSCEAAAPGRVGRGTTTLAAQVAERIGVAVVASPHVVLVSEHGDVAFAVRPADGGPITRDTPRADAASRWTETVPTHDARGTLTGSTARDVPPAERPFPHDLRPGRLAEAGRDPDPPGADHRGPEHDPDPPGADHRGPEHDPDPPGTALEPVNPHGTDPRTAVPARPDAVPAVPGSRFHGLVRPEPAIEHVTVRAEHVVRDLLETQPPQSPLQGVRIDVVTRPPDDPRWPGDAVARVVPVDSQGRELPYGTTPPGGYRIEISDRAGDDAIPRAIGHAVAETAAIEGRLRDGRPVDVPDALVRGEAPRQELSPRDVGRLVEHDLLTARAHDTALTPTERAVARDELDRLRAYLGLDGRDAADIARRRLAGLTEPGDLNPGRRLPAPLGFRDTYADAHYTPDATTYEQLIGEYYFHHPEVVEAARTAVRQLRHVLTELTAAARPDLGPDELRAAVDSAFFHDDPMSAGQVGHEVPLDDLIAEGNLRELMTAVYNASYYHRDNPGTLGHRLLDVIDHDRWEVAERAGVDVDTLRRMRDQLDDNPLRPVLEHLIGYQYARDIFGTGNVAAISPHPVKDSAELTASQRRRPRPEADQRALGLIHTVGDYARLGVPVGRFERAYLERYLRTELTDDTELPWREGHTLHIVSHNPWARAMDKRGLLPVDGVSGTTARMLTAARLMGLDEPTLQLTVRGLMAWMLPGRDHSMFEILRGVEIAGLLPDAPRGERFDPTAMYRDVPGTPLAAVRAEIAPAGLVPHETGYLRLAVDPAGFSETQHKVQDIADALWPQLRDGVVTDARLAHWLRENGYDPDVPASVRGLAVHLTRPHLMALAVYTRHSHYLINNVIRAKMWLHSDAVVRHRFNVKVDDLVHDYLGTLAAGRKPLPLALLLRTAVHTGDGHLTSDSPLTPAARRFVDAFAENREWMAEAARLAAAGRDPSPAAGPAAVALARMIAAEKEVRAAVDPLRAPLLAETRRHADMVHDALLRMPTVGRPDRPVIAYRGDWLTPVHSPIYGGVLSPHGQAREVLSMSRLLEVGVRFMAENPASGRKILVVYRLTGHYARDLSVFSSFPDDLEMVFPPGARLVRVDDPDLAARVYDELPPAWQDACEIIVMDEE